MRLYHATTPKKAQLYRQTGYIKAPVRGFDSLQAAMAWCIKTGRTVILEFDVPVAHKLPDHHNQWGLAYWAEQDVRVWVCSFSADTDA